MKITQVSVYQVDLPLKEGSYDWSGGKSVSVLNSTIVRIDTDNDLSGWGEVCPLGPFHLPAFAQGVQAGIFELEEVLIGANPVELTKLNQNMDICLAGHPYIKSAIDMACWDILGKHFGESCCELMGGRYGGEVDLFRTISLNETDAMAENVAYYREEGYRNFHINIGSGDIAEDIATIQQVSKRLETGDRLIVDGNGSFISEQALRICRNIQGLDLYLENLGSTYQQNQVIRSHWDGPILLDESIDSISSLISAHTDQAMDGITIKISKLGGLTKAKQARDLAVELGMSVVLTDSWGSQITSAAISHLAQSTPVQNRLGAIDFSDYGIVTTAKGLPESETMGSLSATNKPGLGIEPKGITIGEPIYTLK